MGWEKDIEQLDEIRQRIVNADGDYHKQYRAAGIYLGRAYKAVTEAKEALELLIKIPRLSD